ncbi:TonB-dependent receptor [Sphingopyxis sp.]|uniref:TonB-dependent receptor n=1 Tax=Sphingopyxis sp. TaxID=1908224 RepID=UPI0010F4C26D|nr:TonB-dependent receptor [Sphingopyxis sp.]MBR2171117.1 TonB-dependent receptor [Sphingopyxis sp.]
MRSRSRHSMSHRALVAGFAIQPFLWVSPAFGQTQAAAEDSAADSGDIVVTAQRRSERATDVPISITALGADTLEAAGVLSTGDLGKVTPGLSMDRAGPFSQPTIRGIGSSVTGPGINTSVATYIDGYYQPSTVSSDFSLADVASVQVLKGPQGTLFGRNSTGGAILVTTLAPSFDPMARARISYASYDDITATAVVSTGLTDKIAVLLSGLYRHDRGYARDVVTNAPLQKAREYVVRGKVLFKPSDEVSLTLAYTHGDVDDPWGVAQVAYRGVSAAAGIPGVIVPDRPKDVAATLPPESRVNYDAVIFTADVDLGGVNIKSYTGYRDERDYVQLDSDKTAFAFQYIDFRPVDETFTQEIDISSTGSGPLQWVAGLYYYHDKAGYLDLGVTQGGPRFTFLNARLKSEAYAAFADVTYEVSSGLYLTGGVRYNNEKVTETFDSILSNYVPASFSKTFENLSPRAVIRFEPTANSSLYLSYNQGYKAGTFNPTGLSPTPVRPEKIDAFEAGYKMRSGGTLFEVAGYYYDYKDLQFVSYVGATAQLTNAAKARIYGAEVNLEQHVGDHLTLSANAAWTDAKYRDFTGANHYEYLGNGVIVNGPDDASGNPMVRTPKFAARGAIEFHAPLAGGEFRANAAVKYQSRIRFDPFGETGQGEYALVDARVAWTDPSGHVTIAAFGANLTDKDYYAVVTQQSESWPANYGHPRRFGVELSFRY